MQTTLLLQAVAIVLVACSVSEARSPPEPNPCDMPVVEGRCDALIARFAFFKDDKECREFNYGGCGGNTNNFETLQACQDTCQRNIAAARAERDTPIEPPKASCDVSTCPQAKYLAHYRELAGCEPIFDPADSCCAKRYDCSSRSSHLEDKCYFNGRVLNVGDELPSDVTPKCLVHCRCQKTDPTQAARVSCVSIECPELFMGPLTDPQCVRQFSPDSCCSTTTFCAPSNTTLAEAPGVAKCEWGGQTYIEGQKFYPDEQPCMTCLCKPGFNGKLEAPFCNEARCNLELHYSARLRRGCVPVYYEDRCCPIDWRCPDTLNITTEATPTEKTPVEKHDTDCVFGALRFPLGAALPASLGGECVRCSCAVPPVPTCVKNYSHCEPVAAPANTAA